MPANLTDEKREFIEFMLEAEVLRFGQFTTKSGRLSPYFVNTGLYRTGRQIARLGEFYAAMIMATCGDGFDAMFGPAYKGIPLATAAAATLSARYGVDKPYLFNRKEAKDHGEGGVFIGHTPRDRDRIIIIEDVVTAGTAVRETLPLLKNAADVTVRDMFISVDRCEVGFGAQKTAVQEILDDFGIAVHALVTAADLRDYLRERDPDSATLDQMERYMDEYCILP